MPSIHSLSSDTIAHIAAGEVIERPASVIKELLDNAIDADASIIKIEVEESGLSSIMVTDNGYGMNSADLELCFLPHTTSKLRTIDDLTTLKSLGFRGEALASLAAVSNVTIRSREETALSGYEVVIHRGKIANIQPVGMPPGTVVKCEGLFAEIPARKKFLHHPKTELRAITSLITEYSIAFPEVGFRFQHHQRLIIDVPSHQSLLDRTTQLLGQSLGSAMIPFSFHRPLISITGLLGLPQLARSHQHHQFISLNNRPVHSTPISQVIKQSYHSLLEAQTHPCFILVIEMPAGLVDINVHPRKEEVRFFDQTKITELINQAVTETLEQANLTYHNTPTSEPLHLKDSFQPAGTMTHQTLKQLVSTWETTQTRGEIDILQAHDVYLILPTPDGILIIDQHAAHERILYEQYLQMYQSHQWQQQLLDPALVLELSLPDTQMLIDSLPLFTDLGFEISHFGQQSFKVSAIPKLLEPDHAKQVILELLDDILAERKLRVVDTLTHRTLSYLACRSAVKQGDALSLEQRNNLVHKLAECRSNYTCPHGRPTQVMMSWRTLEKMFKRT